MSAEHPVEEPMHRRPSPATELVLSRDAMGG